MTLRRRVTRAVRTYRAPGDTISPRAFPDVVLAVSDFMPPLGETS